MCITLDERVKCVATPQSTLFQMSSGSQRTDTLNDLFQRPDASLKTIIDLYLRHADAFHVDQTSGGKVERVEQFIKFIIALAAPEQQ